MRTRNPCLRYWWRARDPGRYRQLVYRMRMQQAFIRSAQMGMV